MEIDENRRIGKTTRNKIIEWFYNLNFTDMLSLYEGCEKLGVEKNKNL